MAHKNAKVKASRIGKADRYKVEKINDPDLAFIRFLQDMWAIFRYYSFGKI